jgi:acyl dehydratase
MQVGDSFAKDVMFDRAGISAFAQMTGDTNPLHHDADYAARTRFGGIIASGSQVLALLSGMAAGYFAEKGVNVGLDFTFRFLAPMPADDNATLRWRVTGITPKPSLKGDIVALEGEAVRSDGTVSVSASGHAVLFYP